MNPNFTSRFRFAVRSAVLLMALPMQAVFALDYQIHGFAAQGLSVSGGNNYYGDSTHVSTNFYELGLNGTLSLTPDLLISAQVLDRRAGRTDSEGLRLDFAQIDWRFLSTTKYDAGVRLGRVKNPFGFYNETRDVVFTRPGITLPDAIYLESEGVRSLLFSRDGGQLYGDAQFGEHYLSFEGNYALNSRLSKKEIATLSGGIDLPVDVDLEDFRTARLQDEWNGGMLKFALSYLHGKLDVSPSGAVPISGSVIADLFVGSVRYNAQRFSLTGEYEVEFLKEDTSLQPPQSVAADAFYVQGEYHFLPHWTALARYNASFANRHDRDGREFAAQTGGDRYGQFSHDETIGANWQPSEHWGLWAEFHLIQGHSSIPLIDNIGRTPADHSSLFQLMAAYRF